MSSDAVSSVECEGGEHPPALDGSIVPVPAGANCRWRGVNCPNCGGVMRLDDGKDVFACDYCGHLHFPGENADGVRVLGTPAGFSCPVCRAALVDASVERERIRYCERCRGMLIGVDDFVILVEKLRSGSPARPGRRVDARELARPLDCPRCGRRMDTHPYAGGGNIVIDNCPPCGLNWLDHAELSTVAGTLHPPSLTTSL